VQEHLAIALMIATLGEASCVLESRGSGASALDASVPSDAGDTSIEPSTSSDAAADAASAALPDAGSDAAVPADEPDAATPLCSDDPALVACYPLDGDALDHGPHHNDLHATSIGWDPEGGVLLSADSKLFCPNRSELSHAVRTLLAWVRVDALPLGGRSGIIDRDREYGLFVHAEGELRCAIAISAAGWVSAPAALEEGHWHHIACVAQADALELYVDGTLTASAQGSGSAPSNGTPLHIGADSPNGADPFIGAIDDVQIWDTAWTADQLRQDASQRTR
jgi:hypothetical protein